MSARPQEELERNLPDSEVQDQTVPATIAPSYGDDSGEETVPETFRSASETLPAFIGEIDAHSGIDMDIDAGVDADGDEDDSTDWEGETEAEGVALDGDGDEDEDDIEIQFGTMVTVGPDSESKSESESIAMPLVDPLSEGTLQAAANSGMAVTELGTVGAASKTDESENVPQTLPMGMRREGSGEITIKDGGQTIDIPLVDPLSDREGEPDPNNLRTLPATTWSPYGSPGSPPRTIADTESGPASASKSKPSSGSQSRSKPKSSVSRSGSGSRHSKLSSLRQPGQNRIADAPNVPGYEILSKLGQGGMGVVYKARQMGLDRFVALKMIRGAANREMLDRFEIEAQAVARMRHPNIVQIFEIGEAEGMPYFSLELLEGGSLNQRLNNTPQKPRDVAEWMATLARAMDAAHRAEIIHRDLKPPNVMLTADGTLKITDFGLAKRLEAEEGHTIEGQIMGTPSYMAPEQADGKVSDLGPPVDIYALGAILYEMLTGRPPFKGPSPMATVYQVVHEEAVPPSRLVHKTPRDLETICLKALMKEPARRYPTAGELADDLDRYLRGEAIKARPVPFWERSAKWVRRRPAAAALIGVSALTIIGGSGAWAAVADARYRKSQTELENARLVGETRKKDLANAELKAKNETEGRKRAELEVQKLGNQQRENRRLSGLIEASASDIKQAQAALETKQYAKASDFLNRRLSVLESEALLAAEPALPANPTAGDQEFYGFLTQSRRALQERQEEARTLLTTAESKIAEANRIVAEHDQFNKDYVPKRALTLLLSTGFTGSTFAANVEDTRKSARATLALYSTPDSGKDDRWILGKIPDSLAPAEQEEVRAGYREALLALGDAIALPLPGEDMAQQARQALAVLDAGFPEADRSAAYHYCRAAILKRLGDAAGEAGELQAAAARPARSAADLCHAGWMRSKQGDRAGGMSDLQSSLAKGFFWAGPLLATLQLRDDKPELAGYNLSASIAAAQLQGRVYPILYLLHGFASAEEGKIALAQARIYPNEQFRLFADAKARFTQAMDDYNRTEELMKAQPNVREELAYALLVNRGLLQLQRAKLPGVSASQAIDAAVVDLNAAKALMPKPFQAYAGLAQAHLAKGEAAGAIVEFGEAIKNNQDQAFLFRNRARAAMESGILDHERIEQALGDLKQAISLEKIDRAVQSDDHARVAQLLVKAHRPVEAIAAADAAIQIDKAHAQAHIWKLAALLELASQDPKKHDELLEVCDRYRERGKPMAEIEQIRGLSNMGRGRYDEAIEDFTRALTIRSDFTTARRYRAWAYFASRAYQLAETDFSKLIESAPGSDGDPDAEALLGRAASRIELARSDPEWTPKAATVCRDSAADADSALKRLPKTTRNEFIAGRVQAVAASILVPEVKKRGPQFAQTIKDFRARAKALINSAARRLPENQRQRFFDEQVAKDPILDELFKRF